MKSTLGAGRQLVALVVLYVTWAVPAAAQAVGDHLKCYKARDPQAKTSYSADLGGLVTEPGCTIKVPAIIACVPATKTNVTPAPPGSGSTGTPNTFGCYKVRCPKVTLPTLLLNDQFGSRSVTPSAPKLLCAPAAPPTTTTSTTTTLPPCGGGPSSCSGACPSGLTCAFVQDMSPFCGCVPDGSQLCGDATFPYCNGQCPSGQVCGAVSDTPNATCFCHPVGTTACGDAQTPACGGVCPDASQQCGAFRTGTFTLCACVDAATACGCTANGPVPGVCPPGEFCDLGACPTGGCAP